MYISNTPYSVLLYFENSAHGSTINSVPFNGYTKQYEKYWVISRRADILPWNLHDKKYIKLCAHINNLRISNTIMTEQPTM